MCALPLLLELPLEQFLQRLVQVLEQVPPISDHIDEEKGAGPRSVLGPAPLLTYAGSSSGLLDVERVVKKGGELHAPVSELREPRRIAVTRVEVRGRVVGREEDERVEELEESGAVA